MEAACKRAISLDSLDEELHYLMIQSLEAQGKNKLCPGTLFQGCGYSV